MHLYIDGPIRKEIKKFISLVMDLLKSSFKNLVLKIILVMQKIIKNVKQASLKEVIADKPVEMIRQAKIINELGKQLC